MTADERIATLEDQLQQALQQVRLLEEQLAAAHKRIEELEKPPPAFAKANGRKPKASEKTPRKKREAQHNHGRRREAPTRIVEHWIVCLGTWAAQGRNPFLQRLALLSPQNPLG